MNKEWFVIKNLKEFVNCSRCLVFQNFGKDSTKENEIDNMLDDIANMSIEDESEMNTVLSYDESWTIVQPFLRKQFNKKTKKNRYLISESLYLDIINALNDRMVSNILNSLVNKGLIETAYDTESNDFVFWCAKTLDKNDNKEKPEAD